MSTTKSDANNAECTGESPAKARENNDECGCLRRRRRILPKKGVRVAGTRNSDTKGYGGCFMS